MEIVDDRERECDPCGFYIPQIGTLGECLRGAASPLAVVSAFERDRKGAYLNHTNI